MIISFQMAEKQKSTQPYQPVMSKARNTIKISHEKGTFLQLKRKQS